MIPAKRDEGAKCGNSGLKRGGTVKAPGRTDRASHSPAAREDRDGLSPLRTGEMLRLRG